MSIFCQASDGQGVITLQSPLQVPPRSLRPVVAAVVQVVLLVVPQMVECMVVVVDIGVVVV